MPTISPHTYAAIRRSVPDVLIWIGAAAVLLSLELHWSTQAMFGTEYIPAFGDSFYHMRRILDAVPDLHRFYEFDPRIHAPYGSWITWPWLYDYALAALTGLAVRAFPHLDPVAFLDFFPVAWAAVNAALLLWICRLLELPVAARAIALACFALSPLNGFLHSPGRIDHHFMEMTFVLAAVGTGMSWFREPGSRTRAVLYGAVLGLAPGMHNGLFLLQLPLLATVGLLWIRRIDIARFELAPVCMALAGVTLCVLIPSAPFRAGFFEYYYLSWFHLYVALCTGLLALVMQHRAFSTRALGLFAGLAILLSIPIAAQVIHGMEFVSGQMYRVSEMRETASHKEVPMHRYAARCSGHCITSAGLPYCAGIRA